MADSIEARRKLAFAERISEVEGIINPSFGDYIFFPLSHIFAQQQKFTDRAIELSLQCIHILILKCWHVNIAGELAKQLMIMLTFIIGGSPDGSRPSKASEETKLAATKCIESLFAGVTRSTAARSQFALVQNAPSLGHSLTVLLDTTSVTAFTDLQVATIGAVHHLFTGVITDDDVLASFLPGTVSTLCKFLDSRTSSSRKSKALVRGIETLTDVLRIVLMDIKTSNLPSSDGMNGSLSYANNAITTLRTQSWLHATSEQVRMGLTGVCGLRKHRMLNVKMALLKLCRAIARDCSQSLESLLTIAVETLVSLSADKEGALNSQAQETLSALASFNDQIAQVIQKSLHGWILSLPRILQANDEDKKSHLLREIAVSFKILSDLGRSSDILLDSFSRNLKDSVISLTETSTSTISVENVVPDISQASMELIRREAQTDIVFPPTIMPEKNQEETSKNTLGLLQTLGGTSIGLQLVHEHIREARVATDLSKAISMWMALNILRASESQQNEDDWFVDSTSSPKSSQLTAELYSVALSSLLDTYDAPETLPELTCLSLEVLAYAADTMKSEFRTELVDALYPVVHLFGSSVSTVQNHAIITLESIAKSCGYPSTRDLLVENADYLVNAVSLKLNMFNVQPQAPLVLLMMIKLSGPQIIPYLDDLVVSIFAALENFHGYETLTESLFAVLNVIVEESAIATDEIKLITDGKDEEPPEKRNRIKRKHIMTLDDVLGDLDELLQRQSRPLVEELPSEEETPHRPWGKDKAEPSNPFEDPEDEAEEAPTTPKEVEPKPSHTYLMIESITRLSQNFLTSRSPSLRLHLLHLISTASPLLSKQEDNYLPLINQLWPVVVERLKDTEPHILITAIKTITRLCIDCGDFLSSRIEEIWPVIRDVALKAKALVDKDRFLQKQKRGIKSVAQRTDVTGKSLNSYATHNQIWGAVVPLFEAMAGYTRICEGVFDEIVGMVAQDLADGEEGCEGLREALEGVDGNVVWVETVRRSEELRERWKAVPEPVVVSEGGKQRKIFFTPVKFTVGTLGKAKV
ncbi:hypothetical protein ABW19_dt0205301 [Dactylella cylindrospora]|nr:hypothetical protein ABW19_dt0205301 [Dactylella cylindrospora]